MSEGREGADDDEAVTCIVTSTWSSCGREKEMALTHRRFGKGGKGTTAQLDYVVGPRRTLDKEGEKRIAQLNYITGPRWKSDEAYINDDVKLMGLLRPLPDLRCCTEKRGSEFCEKKDGRHGQDGDQQTMKQKLNSRKL